MAHAFAIGIKPAELLWMTPRELYACFVGARIAMKQDQKSNAVLAWSTAMFSRQKRMKPLKVILQRIDPPKPMTPAEMGRALISTFTQLGAKVNYRKKGESRDPEE